MLNLDKQKTAQIRNPLGANYVMTTQRRHIIRLVVLLFIIAFADYSPILYFKIFPSPGTWPNFYTYDKTTPANVLTEINKIKNSKIDITYIPDNGKSYSNYTQVIFHDKLTNIYYHSWVLTDTIHFKDFSQIVFGYISKSLDIKEGKRINADYDFVTNYFNKRRFEDLVISKLKLDRK